MGEVIQEIVVDRPEGKWILVGHGVGSHRKEAPDPYEPGMYMPLTQRDILQFSPDIIFLGHNHLNQQEGNLYLSRIPLRVEHQRGLPPFSSFSTLRPTR